MRYLRAVFRYALPPEKLDQLHALSRLAPLPEHKEKLATVEFYSDMLTLDRNFKQDYAIFGKKWGELKPKEQKISLSV